MLNQNFDLNRYLKFVQGVLKGVFSHQTENQLLPPKKHKNSRWQAQKSNRTKNRMFYDLGDFLDISTLDLYKYCTFMKIRSI